MRSRRALLVCAGLSLAGCSMQQAVLQRVADGLAAGQSGDEDDLELARDAAPAWLKASEAVLDGVPAHLKLAEAVAAGFTQYAYAFVATEAERIEGRDAAAARRLRQRAARLYRRGHRHAMRALELNEPGLTGSLAGPGAALPVDRVGAAYWAAAAWGAWISLAKDEPDVVADLPRAVELARRAWLAQPGFGRGDLAALMGSFEAARPGGAPAQAERYFAQALQAGEGRNPAVQVAIAEQLALPSGDRARFERSLRLAIEAAGTRTNLPDRVMAERAERLLASADDLF